MEFFNKEKFIQDAMANGITRKAAIKLAESYVITECQYESDSDSDSESDLLDLETMTLAQLRAECVENGISSKGNKSQLKDRLYDWDDQQCGVESGASESESEEEYSETLCLAETAKALSITSKPKAKPSKPKPKAKPSKPKPKAKAPKKSRSS
jgi:hypothetical protein